MQPDPRLFGITTSLYRVAAKAVIVCDQKVLLVRDDPEDNWAFPGGGVDYGESVVTGLYRELSEELLLDKEAFLHEPVLLYASSGHTKNGIPRVNIYYHLSTNQSVLNANGDIEELQWVDKDQLLQVIFDGSVGDTTDILPLIQHLLS